MASCQTRDERKFYLCDLLKGNRLFIRISAYVTAACGYIICRPECWIQICKDSLVKNYVVGVSHEHQVCSESIQDDHLGLN